MLIDQHMVRAEFAVNEAVFRARAQSGCVLAERVLEPGARLENAGDAGRCFGEVGEGSGENDLLARRGARRVPVEDLQELSELGALSA